ncbi:hypothetical protein Tco_0138932 [Tanacetum coccineum]
MCEDLGRGISWTIGLHCGIYVHLFCLGLGCDDDYVNALRFAFVGACDRMVQSIRCLRFVGKRTNVNARSRRSTKVDESNYVIFSAVLTRSDTIAKAPCRFAPRSEKVVGLIAQGCKIKAEIGDSMMIGLELEKEKTRSLPWKGVVPFDKKGELAPRYIGPFEILERIGPVAYRLRLPDELSIGSYLSGVKITSKPEIAMNFF